MKVASICNRNPHVLHQHRERRGKQMYCEFIEKQLCNAKMKGGVTRSSRLASPEIACGWHDCVTIAYGQVGKENLHSQ